MLPGLTVPDLRGARHAARIGRADREQRAGAFAVGGERRGARRGRVVHGGAQGPHQRERLRGPLTKKSGKIFRVGIFLDFVWLTTRTPHGGACGEPDEIVLTAMGVELNGSRCRSRSRSSCSSSGTPTSTSRSVVPYRIPKKSLLFAGNSALASSPNLSLPYDTLATMPLPMVPMRS